ncbi:MAG TPA: PEP-CTERM sorting domain-containing protein [Edaphobacter sp.]|nr:PEP-CTERM sorting domain-containing protein [Edaphobacter sp.]
MKRTHLAIAICGVSVLLAAEPICKRLTWHVPVPPRATKKLDHKPTEKTILAWKAWDEAKTLREYDFACGPVATIDIASDELLREPVDTLDAAEGLIDDIALPDYDVAQVYLPPDEGHSPPWLPVSHPGPPPAVSNVPEPGSLWLILAGVFGLALIRKAKEVRA